MIVKLDFETKSEAKLKGKESVGAHKYAEHPSTRIISLSYQIDRDRARLWLPCWPFPKTLRDAVAAGATFKAHKADFEKVIWRVVLPRHGVRVPCPTEWRCTLAACAYRALPQALDKVGAVLDLPIQKSKRGEYLINRLCKRHKPSKKWPTGWVTDPHLYREMYKYNLTDVEAEDALDGAIGELPEREQMLWTLNQAINERGIQVDLEAVDAAKEIVEKMTGELTLELKDVTSGAVETHNQVAAMVNWCAAQKYAIPDLTADTIENLLENAPGEHPMPPQVRRVLEIRQGLAKSSTAKLDKIKACVLEDGRVRGITQYHGALTGRDAGRDVNLLNMPRPANEDIDMEDLIYLVKLRDTRALRLGYGGDPMQAISDSIRGMFISGPGRDFQVSDFGAIEARITAWLAGEEWKLKLFEAGGDPYCAFASTAVGYEVTKATHPKDRQNVGKPGELAFGYQGGVKAWRRFDRSDRYTDAEVDAFKVAWRKKHPGVVNLWYGLERAAGRAVLTGKPQQYANIVYDPVVDNAGWWLTCILPNGKRLWYYKPEVDPEDTPYGVRYNTTWWGRRSQQGGSWGKVYGYGGHFLENVSQAITRELLCDAMIRMEYAGYPILLTPYDEAVTEPLEGHGSQAEFDAIMAAGSSWAPGLPITAAGWRGKRLHK